jgi:ketosteroid isomerase-like protein
LAEPAARVGPEGIGNYMREFLRQWVGHVIEAKELKAIGDTVLASTVWRAAGRESGIPMEVSFFMLFTFRGGKIGMVDEAEALEAVGLRG